MQVLFKPFPDFLEQNKQEQCRIYDKSNSHKQGKLITLKEYVDAMAEGQEKIYFVPGENKERLAKLPQVETLDKKGYVRATPVQAGAIPYFMEWKDVIAKAPTGTGKTFAFGIPMVEHIDPKSSDVLALVLAPTRELAVQIQEELRDLSIAIAEKVIHISLKSSLDVIGRMIQMATEKLRRREWVHSYVGGYSTRELSQITPELTMALSGISDHIKITPMPEDERGACIIEMPDAIIDASASTQLQNIREILGQS